MSEIIETLKRKYGDIEPILESASKGDTDSLPRDMTIGELVDLLNEDKKEYFYFWMDDNFPEQKEMVKHLLETSDDISTSLIQRKCMLGFNRSQLILKQLQKYGLVGTTLVGGYRYAVNK